MSEYKKLKLSQETPKFLPVQVYQGFDMYFLKNTYSYKLITPMILIKTKYNYKIKNIEPYDLNQLNEILEKFADKLKLGKLFFINNFINIL